MTRRIVATFALAATIALAAPAGPYDENADAKGEIRSTLAAAVRAHLPVLVVLGANWCTDCRILDLAFHQGSVGPLIEREFKVVKVDVGRFNRNTDIARTYDVPLEKGIPAIAVLTPEGTLLYATREGELADARAMGEQGIHDFFARTAARLKQGRS